METPYLTEKTCRNRYLVSSLSIPLLGIILCLAPPVARLVLSILFSGLLISTGRKMGESIFWFQLKRVVQREKVIPDPLKGTSPSDLELSLFKYRFMGSMIFMLAISMITILNLFFSNPDSGMGFTGGVLQISFLFFTGIFTAFQYYSLRRKEHIFNESSSIAISRVDSVIKLKTWWSKEEARQEIRRQ